MSHMRLEWNYICNCVNVKAPCSKHTHSLKMSECSVTWTQSKLVCKRKLNHLTKLVKWLSCVVSTYLYFALILCFCHVTYGLEWIYTPSLLECKVSHCSKQARYRKFKGLQWNSKSRFEEMRKLYAQFSLYRNFPRYVMQFQFKPHLWLFQMCIFFRKRLKPWFLVTFKIIKDTFFPKISSNFIKLFRK